jgi:hypothetical protein
MSYYQASQHPHVPLVHLQLGYMLLYYYTICYTTRQTSTHMCLWYTSNWVTCCYTTIQYVILPGKPAPTCASGTHPEPLQTCAAARMPLACTASPCAACMARRAAAAQQLVQCQSLYPNLAAHRTQAGTRLPVLPVVLRWYPRQLPGLAGHGVQRHALTPALKTWSQSQLQLRLCLVPPPPPLAPGPVW